MKTIVILSTEPWGKMLLSKMHYAIELSRLGHHVFFINPPAANHQKHLVAVGQKSGYDNLTIVTTKAIKGALFLRHKLFFLYKMMAAKYISGIQKLVKSNINEVWCFDPHMYVDLKKFEADKTIMLLYDFYTGSHVAKAAQSADAIATISQVILDHYQQIPVPKILLQHGLGNAFAMLAENKLDKQSFSTAHGGPTQVGYMGNLLREGMNTKVASRIITANPTINFNFWGPHSLAGNNVTNTNAIISKSCTDFIAFLQAQPNVLLHGMKDQHQLAEAINQMDAFLFLYSASGDMNKASNSHKLLEYLSTGKVIISTYVSNYGNTSLLEMCAENNEEQLPAIFNTVINNLEHYNAAERQVQRINFALHNTYKNQIKRIQEFVYQNAKVA